MAQIILSPSMENSPMSNMPFAVTPQQVLKAVLDADRRGAGGFV